MKKIIIISGASILLLVLSGIWVYMLLINEPDQNGSMFADFNFFAEQDTTPFEIPEPTDEAATRVNVGATQLRQLTTRPVIGFTEVFATTSVPYQVVYAEAGTGHLYQINMETGEEKRISNTTIPNASQAEIASDGKTVVMRSGFTANNNVILGTLNEVGGLDNQTLPFPIADMVFSTTGNLLYTEPTENGLRARQLQVTDQVTNTLFEIPFRDAEIIWSLDGVAPHYVYSKPSAKLQGYMYAIENNRLQRLPIAGPGITAVANARFVNYSQLFTTEHIGLTFNTSTRETTGTPIVTIPEKCAYQDSTSSILYCGHEIAIYDFEFPDSWYKGIKSFSDRLWAIDLEEGSAQQLANPVQISGREIDMTHMTASANTDMLYFINKHDNTLWSYER